MDTAITLEKLCEPDRNITYGVVKPGPEVEDGIRFIRGGDIFQGRIAEDVLRTISPQLSEQYKRTILRGGELLVSLVGSPGEVAVVPERLSGANIARQVGLIPLGVQANPIFVMYFLRSPLGRAQLFTRTQGAVQQVINLADLKTIEVPDLSLDVQKRIASILTAYDDLIENNRRRIQLLEQAARILYKEWFVHLRFPGHEHVKIKDGVPEGWEEGVLSDFYETASGGTPSRKILEFYTGDIPWVKTQELTGGFILSTEEKITEEAIKLSSAKLFARHTVLVAMYGATIGQTAILSVPSATNQACCAVLPKAPGTTYVHAYLLFSQHKADFVGLGQGAAQKNISQQIIKSFKMTLPAKTLLDAFSESVCPLFDQIEVLQKANVGLSKARDLLLPRLMNGEVSV